MIIHINPVADVLTVAVDRQRPPHYRIADDHWYQLFGILIGSVVVAAVRDNDGKIVGDVPGTHQMIRCSLGG